MTRSHRQRGVLGSILIFGVVLYTQLWADHNDAPVAIVGAVIGEAGYVG